MASVLPGIANVGALLRLGNRAHPLSGEAHPHQSPRTAYRPAALVAVGFFFLPFVGVRGFSYMAVALRASAPFSCISGSSWGTWPNAGARTPTCAFGFMLLFSGIVLGELAAWTPYRVPSFGLPGGFQHVSLVHARRLRGAWLTAPYAHTRPPRWAACPSLS